MAGQQHRSGGAHAGGHQTGVNAAEQLRSTSAVIFDCRLIGQPEGLSPSLSQLTLLDEESAGIDAGNRFTTKIVLNNLDIPRPDERPTLESAYPG